MKFFAKVGSYVKGIVNLSDHIDTVAAEQSIRSNIYFKGPNAWILSFSIIIASIGLNINSIPVIIGAMLISPLMGPILGFGLGLGTNDTALIKLSLKNFGVMVLISILASTLYFIISPLQLTQQTELLARTNPTIYDVLIATFGGVAGMLENSRREKGTVLAGVAIATALMPPLCTVGFGLATLNWHFISGALYLFIINSIFIALATFIVVKYLRFPSIMADADEAKVRRTNRAIGIIMTIIIVPSIISAVNIVKQSNFDRSVQTLVERNKVIGRSYIFNYQTDHEGKTPTVELYVAGEALGTSERERIYADAENLGIARNQVFIQEDAAVKGGYGMDADLMKGIYQNNTRTIESLQETIAKMDTTIRAYKEKELPSELVAMEICSQYEKVAAVVLTRGQSIDSKSGVKQDAIVALMQCTEPLSDAEMQKMQNWLRIRLSSDRVVVLQTIYESTQKQE